MEDFSKYNGEGTTLRLVQQRLTEMLLQVDSICRRNNIPYWIDFGTLLGAVRHGGFIPWDDDIDICIRRSDYDRLRQALLRELPQDMVLQDTLTDKNAFCLYGRVRDRRSYCYHPLFRNLNEQGLWLDIFLVDRVPSFAYGKMVDHLYRRTYHEIHHYGDIAYSSGIERWGKRMAAYVLHPISLLLVNLGHLAAKCTASDCLVRYSMAKPKCRQSLIFPLSEVMFEGISVLAPRDTDSYLRLLYGNYMQIPPEEKREHTINLDTVKFL